MGNITEEAWDVGREIEEDGGGSGQCEGSRTDFGKGQRGEKNRGGRVPRDGSRIEEAGI